MPKFESPLEDDRFSPYHKSISKPISKNLLTPCRRIGLSRKKNSPSTPLNTSIKPTTDNETPTSVPMKPRISIMNNKEPTIKPTLKISSQTKGNKADLINTEDEDTTKQNNKTLNEKFSLKQNILESEFINKESLVKKVTKFKKKLPEAKVDVLTANQIKTKMSMKEQVETTLVLENSKTERDPKKVEPPGLERTRKSNEVVKREDTSDKEQVIIVEKQKPSFAKSLFFKSNSEEINSGFEMCHEKKLTPWRKTLSLKKMPSKEADYTESDSKPLGDDTMVLTQFKIKPCSVNLQTLASTELNKLTEEFKEIVSRKHKLLEDLRQAEVYTKLHSLDNLEQLTSVWKRGCISGLEDLLIQLRRHTEIDMSTLLTNLRIPKDYVSLSADGNLE